MYLEGCTWQKGTVWHTDSGTFVAMNRDSVDDTSTGTEGPRSGTCAGSSNAGHHPIQSLQSQVLGPSTEASAAPTSILPSSKRSRAPGTVTPNACTQCRKKRSKVQISSRTPLLRNIRLTCRRSSVMETSPVVAAGLGRVSSAYTNLTYVNRRMTSETNSRCCASVNDLRISFSLAFCCQIYRREY